jgi:heme A synthase
MRDGSRRAPPDDGRYARRLGAACFALVGLSVALIVLGALVRAHAAGLACPDWPLCFGELVPRMNLEVAFEWSHRALAGWVTLAFAALAGLALRRDRLRRRAGPCLLAAGALLTLQIVLGALTVWKLLAAWTVTAHLLIGNAFAATLLLTARRLRDAPAPEAAGVAARALVALAGALLLAQLVLGGLVSSTYAGLACPEWPACRGSSWYPTWRGPVGLHLLHRTNGYLFAAVLGLAAGLVRQPACLRRALLAACALAVAQLGTGVANVLLALPVEVTGLHSALAASLVLVLAWAGDLAFGVPREARLLAPAGAMARSG